MRINQAALTLLCAAVLFIPASREVETTTSTPAVRAVASLPAPLGLACDRAAADPDSLEAMLAGLSAAAQPNDLCVDTLTAEGAAATRIRSRHSSAAASAEGASRARSGSGASSTLLRAGRSAVLLHRLLHT